MYIKCPLYIYKVDKCQQEQSDPFYCTLSEPLSKIFLNSEAFALSLIKVASVNHHMLPSSNLC